MQATRISSDALEALPAGDAARELAALRRLAAVVSASDTLALEVLTTRGVPDNVRFAATSYLAARGAS